LYTASAQIPIGRLTPVEYEKVTSPPAAPAA